MHTPVLLREILEILDPQSNENFVDATFGEGNVSLALINKINPFGKILAFEWDSKLYQLGLQKIKNLKMEKRIKLVNKNFKNIKKVVYKENFSHIKGVVFDLGISNWHYQNSKRGFSFQRDEKLDMRINHRLKITAFEVVNSYSYQELVGIFKNYGEEKDAAKIAKEIVFQRKKKKIETSKELAELVMRVKKTSKKIHPATQIFMALRAFVNSELENLEQGLIDSYDILEKGGKIVVISFQGLENKVIKKVFKMLKKTKGAQVITKNVIKPTKNEVLSNPKSRSAQLRALKKI